MGLPAVKQKPSRSTSRPHLRVVKQGDKKVRRTKNAQSRGAGKRTNSRSRAAVAQQNFRMFVALLAVLGCLGVGRVWLTVEATKASLEADELRADIKTERYEGDMLEVRQSALGAPSRIRAIAGKAMGMTPAGQVTYLDLTKGGSTKEESVTPEVEPARADVSGFESLLARLMNLTAGEAEVLLVGDVGLASSR